MKKQIALFASFTFLLILFFSSCSLIGEIKNKELYSLTDKYVESLYSEYESYGLLGGTPELTKNEKYQVFPLGRLINVKIMTYVEDSVYEQLCKELEAHYKNDSRVSDVYISQAGTIMIDCRN